MLNKIFAFPKRISAVHIVMIAAVMIGAPTLSRAQSCNPPHETVTKLHHPNPGSYMVWNALYGEGEGQEFLKSVLDEGEHFLAAGEAHDAKTGRSELVLARFDKRGRMTWDERKSMPGLREVVKLLPAQNGEYMIAANKKGAKNKSGKAHTYIWLGFFNKHGKLKREKKIALSNADIYANDIIESADKKGWALAVTSEKKLGHKKNAIMQKAASLYLLDAQGNKRTGRSYILGTNSSIIGLSSARFPDQKQGYIATGYFEIPSGKKLGWIMRLNDDASLVWQKEYSRGLSAKLKRGILYHKKYILAFGDAKAADTGLLGGWLSLLDAATGETMWQRYYHGEIKHHDYAAGDIYANRDNLIVLMMMARPRTRSYRADDAKKAEIQIGDDAFDGTEISEYVDYTHLLTLSPRGVTLSGDAYYYGHGVSIAQMIEDKTGQRILVGGAQVPAHAIAEKKEKAPHPAPLIEKGYIHLPEAALSDKTKAGLAMLKNKIKNQPYEQGDHEKDESAKFDKIVYKGWLAVGEMLDRYRDPCAPRFK